MHERMVIFIYLYRFVAYCGDPEVTTHFVRLMLNKLVVTTHNSTHVMPLLIN